MQPTCRPLADPALNPRAWGSGHTELHGERCRRLGWARVYLNPGSPEHLHIDLAGLVGSVHTECMLSADTWGISGSQFLAIYAITALLVALLALGLHISARRGDAGTPRRELTPLEVAYLTGGPTRAVYAALAGLRAAEAVDVGPLRELITTGPIPPGLGRLEHAVYSAAERHRRVAGVSSDSAVSTALTTLHDDLVNAGWLSTSEQRARARRGGWLMLGLAGVGLVRTVAGLANSRPVGYLLLLTLAVAACSVPLFVVGEVTPAGRRALVQVRRTSPHLRPGATPSWSTYGVAGAALGVALYGTAAFWAADPAFAAGADMQWAARDGSSSTNLVGGSSGCGGGGGGSCGGGGGCGGGGCGGGCGG